MRVLAGVVGNIVFRCYLCRRVNSMIEPFDGSIARVVCGAVADSGSFNGGLPRLRFAVAYLCRFGVCRARFVVSEPSVLWQWCLARL